MYGQLKNNHMHTYGHIPFFFNHEKWIPNINIKLLSSEQCENNCS